MPKLERSTAHILRPLPVLSLVAAILRLKVRRGEQLELQLKAQEKTK